MILEADNQDSFKFVNELPPSFSNDDNGSPKDIYPSPDAVLSVEDNIKREPFKGFEDSDNLDIEINEENHISPIKLQEYNILLNIQVSQEETLPESELSSDQYKIESFVPIGYGSYSDLYIEVLGKLLKGKENNLVKSIDISPDNNFFIPGSKQLLIDRRMRSGSLESFLPYAVHEIGHVTDADFFYDVPGYTKEERYLLRLYKWEIVKKSIEMGVSEDITNKSYELLGRYIMASDIDEETGEIKFSKFNKGDNSIFKEWLSQKDTANKSFENFDNRDYVELGKYLSKKLNSKEVELDDNANTDLVNLFMNYIAPEIYAEAFKDSILNPGVNEAQKDIEDIVIKVLSVLRKEKMEEIDLKKISSNIKTISPSLVSSNINDLEKFLTPQEELIHFIDSGKFSESLNDELIRKCPEQFLALNEYLNLYKKIKEKYPLLGLPGKTSDDSLVEVGQSMSDDYVLVIIANPYGINIEEMRLRSSTMRNFIEEKDF